MKNRSSDELFIVCWATEHCVFVSDGLSVDGADTFSGFKEAVVKFSKRNKLSRLAAENYARCVTSEPQATMYTVNPNDTTYLKEIYHDMETLREMMDL